MSAALPFAGPKREPGLLLGDGPGLTFSQHGDAEVFWVCFFFFVVVVFFFLNLLRQELVKTASLGRFSPPGLGLQGVIKPRKLQDEAAAPHPPRTGPSPPASAPGFTAPVQKLTVAVVCV